MDVVSEIRKVNMFTYPVLTYSLLKRSDLTQEELDTMIKTKNWDIFVDKEFAQWASRHNMEWYDSNFFISDNVGVLSNCCRLLSDTRKLDAFKNDSANKKDLDITLDEIKLLYEKYKNDPEVLQ